MTKYVSYEEALDILDQHDDWRQYQVHYPEAVSGPFSLEHFSISRNDLGRKRLILTEGMDRDPGWGEFTKLVETVPGAGEEGGPKRRLWMSDTAAEIREHYPIINKLWVAEKFLHNSRLLVNGLGLAVVVHAALEMGVGHVDVVEINDDVINLVGPILLDLYGDKRVTIWRGDAYTKQWSPGTRWDYAWHDIWPSIDEANLPGMDRLMAKYRRRVQWQGCWQRKGCLSMRRTSRQMEAGTLSTGRALDLLGGKADWVE